MKTYRMNSLMAGLLYLLGTVFGIGSAVIGGEVIASVVTQAPLSSPDLLGLVAASAAQISSSIFLILMMGISLVAMTVFLYPLFKKDSEELAAGMLLFRSALEGAFYLISAVLFLALVVLGHEYVATGADSAALQSMGSVLYKLQSVFAPFGAIVFLIGATCLYISFYRTRLIPLA